MRLLFAVTAVVVLASACGDPRPPSSCLPDCPGTRAYDAIAYTLRAHFDWARARLVASEDVTLALSSSDAVVELDSSVEVSAIHHRGSSLAFAADAGLLTVDLAPLRPGSEPVTFTVEYEAAPSEALMASESRDDDPVRSRVFYTDSEPARGVRWLVAKHHPSDRALWGVELTVAVDEDVISNGERVKDERQESERVVGYRMEEPLPTYLMAFAAGQIAHTTRTTGRIPLAVWYRRGLILDPEATLDVVSGAMATFEDRLGPYPFASYAVVLLPEYGGGMENATITFNGELYGQALVSASLNAHELAHQWFGDWVTMRDYDDVWVKEGMATLLTAEAERATRDREGKGRGFGTDFTFSPDDAIVDSTLTGLAKYTSGPYERGAWLIGQLRARVGETAFWSTLRDVLAQHSLDSIDGPTFVRSFAPALDDATITKAVASLPRHEVPAIAIAAVPSAGATDVTFTITDPGATLLAPINVTVVDATGAAVSHAMDATAPLTVTVPDGGYLAPDESDVHPYWEFSFTVDPTEFYGQLAPLMMPTSAPALAAFESRSAAHQERALYDFGLPAIAPTELDELVAALDSNDAAREAVVQGCAQLGSLEPGPKADAWTTALTGFLTTPPLEGFSSEWGQCPPALVKQALAGELAQLTALNPLTPAQLARLDYLMSFDYGADESFSAFSALATSGPTLRLRDQAIARLALQPSWPYSPIPDSSLETWRGFFRGRLPLTTSATRFRAVWRGLYRLNDASALPLVAPLLHRVPLSAAVQRATVCQAYALSQKVAPESWTAFREAAQPWDTLAPAAAEVLADPTRCP